MNLCQLIALSQTFAPCPSMKDLGAALLENRAEEYVASLAPPSARILNTLLGRLSDRAAELGFNTIVHECESLGSLLNVRSL